MVSVPYFVLLILATVSGTLGNFLIIATVCYTKVRNALITTYNKHQLTHMNSCMSIVCENVTMEKKHVNIV